MPEHDADENETEVFFRSPALPSEGAEPEEPKRRGGFFRLNPIVGGIFVILLLFGFFSAASNTLDDDDSVRNESGAVIEGGDVGALALRVGDCLPRSFVNVLSGGESVSEAPVVPCSDQHAGEVYASYQMPEEPEQSYPGDDHLSRIADRECFGEAFTSYIGAPATESEVLVTWLQPTSVTWERLDDREITCIGVHAEGQDRTGSLRSSGR